MDKPNDEEKKDGCVVKEIGKDLVDGDGNYFRNS